MSQLHSVPQVARGGLNLQRAWWAISRWAAVPVVAAILGAFFGAFASGFANPSAATVVSVNAASETLDATATSRMAENMVQHMSSEAVFARASQSLGGATEPRDLMDRTRISAVASTSLISVQVVAPTSEQAVAESGAIVAAVQALDDEERAAELARVTESVRSLMTAPENGLADAQAEQARRTQLGSAMAVSQASVATTMPGISVVHGAHAVPAAAGPVVLTVAGGLAGALLGLGLALYLGRRKGRVNSLASLARLYPAVPAVSPATLPEILAVEGEQIDTIILVRGTPVSADRLALLADEIREEVGSVAGRGHPIDVVVSPFADAAVRRTASDPSVVALVAVDSTELKMGELAPVLERSGPRTYLVDLLEQE